MEMDPDALWKGFITVVKGAVKGTVTSAFCSCSTFHNHTNELDRMCFTLLAVIGTSYDKCIPDQILKMSQCICENVVLFPLFSFFQLEQIHSEVKD